MPRQMFANFLKNISLSGEMSINLVTLLLADKSAIVQL